MSHISVGVQENFLLCILVLYFWTFLLSFPEHVFKDVISGRIFFLAGETGKRAARIRKCQRNCWWRLWWLPLSRKVFILWLLAKRFSVLAQLILWPLSMLGRGNFYLVAVTELLVSPHFFQFICTHLLFTSIHGNIQVDMNISPYLCAQKICVHCGCFLI